MKSETEHYELEVYSEEQGEWVSTGKKKTLWTLRDRQDRLKFRAIDSRLVRVTTTREVVKEGE